MQTPKDHTRKPLLKTAREAFLREGFKAVSVREISQRSGIGLGNMYNYSYPCRKQFRNANKSKTQFLRRKV
ncbi:TetR/AcrR family transcriptional regulator [Bacteroides heparinolyticus]|uniref:TetR/AcrR family transcriptional regulator n=1 Tax=Prevotella heparinolytica TaxID=28113 RepID=UPI0035A05BD7